MIKSLDKSCGIHNITKILTAYLLLHTNIRGTYASMLLNIYLLTKTLLAYGQLRLLIYHIPNLENGKIQILPEANIIYH